MDFLPFVKVLSSDSTARRGAEVLVRQAALREVSGRS
jgi:hypothetical protein